jgi:MFS family permease
VTPTGPLESRPIGDVRPAGIGREAAVPISAFLAMGMFWGAWAAVVPDVQLAIGASLPELGAALLWAGAAALPAMLVAGRIWARSGPPLVVVTLALFGLSAIGPALATNVLMLGLALAAVGGASGALDVAMNAQVSDIEARTGRRLMYMAHALFSLAVLLTSVSVGLLRSGGISPLPILAAVSIVMLVLAVATWPIVRRQHSRGRPGTGPREALPLTLASPSLRKTLLLLGVLCAAAFLIEDALVSWSALHLERSLGAAPAVGGAGPGLFAGAMFVGRTIGQGLSRRLSDGQVLAVAGGVGAVGIGVVAWAQTSVVALAGLAIAGAGISLVAPALFGRAGRLAGKRSRGQAIAGLTVFGYLGFVAGPPLVGLVAGLTDLRVSFTALAVLAAGLAVTAFVTLRNDRQLPAGEDALPPVARM